MKLGEQGGSLLGWCPPGVVPSLLDVARLSSGEPAGTVFTSSVPYCSVHAL